jgi:iron(III) transport system ATP-binding protein
VTQPAIVAARVSKSFQTRGQPVKALDELSVEVAAGEFVVLLGPSGCGKTTLLRSVAGLEFPDAGDISIDGRLVYSKAKKISLPPEGRRLGMVFQSYALWPHMTVLENVAYPLTAVGTPRAEAGDRVRRVLRTVNCDELTDRYPGQLSGGQQQRVALARAVVAENRVVLFDEPLSNVDAKVREQLRLELLQMQGRLGFTALYVTHDQTEAMVLANRMAVMKLGRIVQVGAPQEVYEKPTSRYVADFVGSGNFFSGTVSRRDGDIVEVATALGAVRGGNDAFQPDPGVRVDVFFRPERCLATAPAGDANLLRGSIESAIYFGPNWEYIVRVAECRVVVWRSEPLPLKAGDACSLWVRPADVRILPAA